MWEPSPSPQESWSDASGANEDGEWPVKAIVGEEVRLDGTSRYEVRWENWHRRDGSNTTWQTEHFHKTLVRQWKRTQKRIRATIADASLDMKVPWPDDAVHKRFTEHRKQAYDEKLERRSRSGPIQTADWDAEIETVYKKLQEPEKGESSSRMILRRGNQASTPGSSSATLSRSTSWTKRSPPESVVSHESKKRRGRPRIDSTPSSSTVSAVATSSSFSHRGVAALTPGSTGSSKEHEIAQIKLPSVIISPPTLRGRMSSAWNKAAKDAMAAMVRISPDVYDDDIPRNLRKFKYLERGYVFCDDELKRIFNVSRGAFTTCDCISCSDHSACSCQNLSEIYELEGINNVFAYSEGLFTFKIPRGVDVTECNEYCQCDNECENRVVQLPRNIGVEIFDTKRCGWGVRALDDIPRGKVLGTYTGLLVRRDQVGELPKEHQGYLFDLDSTEVRNSENPGGRYTVDSYDYGNWTRFVNHSCSPNMEVYGVVYDTIQYVHMPYVAFVASINVPAGTELTIDYHPYTEKKKGKRAAKGDECRCDSAVCRGWLG